MFGVVIRNPRFRRLWLSQIVSQAGDWLNRVAILGLIGELSGSAAQVGLGALFGAEFALRFLPSAFLGPLAGPIADRLPRRLLMVAADILRAGVVLCLLAVDEPEDLPLLYGLLFTQMGLGIFFDSARTASVPNTLPRDELHEGLALSAATWSAMLSVGALAGGLAVQAIGIRGVFILDSGTYIASALLLIGLRLPAVPQHPDPFRIRDILLLRDLRRGLEHVRARGITPVLFAKSFWGGAGGFLVLLSVAGRERFASGETEAALVASAAFATGLLYCARGVGTGIGPILTRRLFGSSDRSLRRMIMAGYAVGALGYAAFVTMDNMVAAFTCVVFAHLGGSTLWVASTTFWQKHIDDAFRGRVYALEFLGVTLSISASAVVGGLLYDATGSIEITGWILSGGVLVTGATWSLLARGVEGRVPASPAD